MTKLADCIKIVHLNGSTYEVHYCDFNTYVFVIKTKRVYNTVLGTYRQRITSAPKIKRIIKLAATLPA